ncbi:hypothetical protein BDW02DRAFT_633298 [Decorospora gaudefroyi]|uniref:BTB domain-containing protein n=1 Tax=Decorospora gaudefroyi TaxID=184978 RepID=A0A6A5K3D3_9PLEO|nr:hypothetical protein BDW02DRAFT_633298 [Decorospora gaudefroyi]
MMRPSAAASDLAITIVEVSAAKKKYHIHRSLLVEHSEYFKKALNGPWTETREGSVTLEDVDCNTFDIFVDWMYAQRLPKTEEAWYAVDDVQQDGPLTALVLANRIIAPPLTAHYEFVIYAFANLFSERPILALLVELQYRRFCETHDTKENGEMARRHRLPHDFLLRIMLRLGQANRDGDAEADLNPCDYHGHASEEAKKQCQANTDEDTDEGAKEDWKV